MSEPYSQGLHGFEKDQAEADMLVIGRLHAAAQHANHLAEFCLVPRRRTAASVEVEFSFNFGTYYLLDDPAS